MLKVNQLVGFGVGGKGLAVSVDFSTPTTLESQSGPSIRFFDLDIGTAAENRYVYCCVTTEATGVGLVTGGTIGGVPVTIAAQSENTGATPDLLAVIVYAPVPTGTLADIELTISGTLEIHSARVSVYRVVNVDIPVYDSTNNALMGVTSTPMTIDVPPRGAVIAVGARSGDTASVSSWTGVNEDSDADSGTYAHGSGHIELELQESDRAVTWVTPTTDTATACVSIG